MFIRGNYWVIPALAAVAWTGTLLGLLLWWIVDDNARPYLVDQQTVLYISNVGAQHKTLFIAGNAVTCFFWALTLLTERWLHHVRRIPGSLRPHETNLDIASVVFGIIGGLALLFLAIFDAVNYANVHWSMTAVFVVCIAVSCACQTAEIILLKNDHVDRNHLKRNALIKLAVAVIAIAGAIAFGACYGVCSGVSKDAPPDARCDRIQSAAAVLEWTIAFLFDAYILTYVWDLWPAHKTRGHKFTPSLIEKDRNNELHMHKDGRPGAPFGHQQADHLAAPQPAHLHAHSDTSSGISQPDTVGPRVGRPSEDVAMRQHNWQAV